MSRAATGGASRWVQGLVVGKFSPLHLGHEWLIAEAAAQCEHLLVLGYSQPELPGCGRERRQQWLDDCVNARHPNVQALAFDEAWVRERCAALGLAHRPQPDNAADDASHQAYLAWLLGGVLQPLCPRPVDALFCSEPWGPACAARLQAAQGHPVLAQVVDTARRTWPVRATQLRAQPAAAQRWVSAPVWASLMPRVVLLGGESTGKTSLAQALAEAWQTEWVPEFGREAWALRGGELSADDLDWIATEQVQREDAAARRAAERGAAALVCDTSPLTTLGYAELDHGQGSARLQALACRPYALWVLCGDEFGLVQDGTRRDRAWQQRQQAWTRARLRELGVTPLPVQGPVAERVAQVSLALRALQGQEAFSPPKRPGTA